VTKESVFQLAKPAEPPLIGYDGLPDRVRRSQILSANNLGQLGNYPSIPAVDQLSTLPESSQRIEFSQPLFDKLEREGLYAQMWLVAVAAKIAGETQSASLFERCAKVALDIADDREFAWKVLAYALKTQKHS
jgi:hypothetical protein